MRWICYAVCIGLVAIQISYSMPASNGNLDSADVKGGVGVGGEINRLSEASEAQEVRVPFVSRTSDDLQKQASGEDNDEAESSQELSDDIEITQTDENSRRKRLGVFGNLFGGGDSGGGEGGSGNFLFDIIRRTADGAGRAAGTVYRFVAGTDNYGPWHGYHDGVYSVPSAAFDQAARTPMTASVSTPSTTGHTGFANLTLVAGSGTSEHEDEHANTPEEAGHSSDDGYQTGIPGPITRLFVIANRGIANLVQDLILRLAQTSERLVNFKARLITAII